MRRYDESVEVRLTDTEGRGDVAVSEVSDVFEGHARPDVFLWRGRLFSVREVLDTWLQRRPWWRLVLDGPHGRDEGGLPAEAGAPVSVGVHDLEERVWRVEASAGRLLPRGVYELVHSGGGAWRLARVDD